eukprot:c21348_g4_i1.p1 GENE.c21348_g4_i1~~c21348_g4_i1.p1  ORF type:complete len:292 (+),score=154.54 c21348_g4_i1:627-1502(+)
MSLLSRGSFRVLSSTTTTTAKVSLPVLQNRTYKSRLTTEAFFEGKTLAKYSQTSEGQSGPYVVEDKKAPTFKVPEGVKVLGFRYPNAKAPDNKTFYSILPRRPPVVLAGVAGEYVEKLYKAAVAQDAVMKVEQDLKQVVLPLVEDEEIERKFFSNTTMAISEKVAAIEAYAKEQKLDFIITDLLLDVAECGTSEYLPAIVSEYSDLMKRIRCEATAEVTFGRIPTKNELIKVKQLLADLRSPNQYYVHSTFSVDPNLGGGLVVKAGDFELDGSLETRANEVRKHMAKEFQA